MLETILIVEDEPALLDTLAYNLKKESLTVETAGDGRGAGRLFQTSSPVNHSVAEVIRNHQLVEAWRRCQQSSEMQSESVEVPARHQFLQLIVIPDSHASGSLLLVQDLTRLRRLETVRRDFVSNLSHALRTPLASLKALTETLQDGALDDPPAARRFIDQI